MNVEPCWGNFGKAIAFWGNAIIKTPISMGDKEKRCENIYKDWLENLMGYPHVSAGSFVLQL